MRARCAVVSEGPGKGERIGDVNAMKRETKSIHKSARVCRRKSRTEVGQATQTRAYVQET
jgi:hypothetical protein